MQVDIDALRRELERLEGAIVRLPMELKEQQANVAAVAARLAATKQGMW